MEKQITEQQILEAHRKGAKAAADYDPLTPDYISQMQTMMHKNGYPLNSQLHIWWTDGFKTVMIKKLEEMVKSYALK